MEDAFPQIHNLVDRCGIQFNGLKEKLFDSFMNFLHAENFKW